MGLGRKKEQVAADAAKSEVVEEVLASPVDVTAKKPHTDASGALNKHREFIQEAEIIAKRKRLFTKAIDEVERLKPDNILQGDGIRFSKEALVDLLTECLLTVEMAESYNTILAEEALEAE